MRINTIQRWVIIGFFELIISLFLISIAPLFLNSNQPIIGLLIWLSVPTVLGGSGIYVALKISNAQKARRLFLAKFPQYSYLEIEKFIEISRDRIAQNLDLLEAANNDPEFQRLNVSLLDLLDKTKKQ
ncbi:MAG: hypothetical protein HC820_06595 [Hydrococcus sp. RM1_1_31]|nr:hypothetical protein [Hydrococcus sp. RM1_1_31]